MVGERAGVLDPAVMVAVGRRRRREARGAVTGAQDERQPGSRRRHDAGRQDDLESEDQQN
jgi:hypothetical protein